MKPDDTGNSAKNTGRTRGLKPFKKGQSGNPSGRPKGAVSVTHWLREWGSMTTAQAAELCTLYAKELRKHDSGDIPLAGVAALRVWMSIMDEPSPGLLSHVLDRIDGTVETKVSSSGDTRITVVYEDDDPEHQSPNRAT